jgi:hypothetical protein
MAVRTPCQAITIPLSLSFRGIPPSRSKIRFKQPAVLDRPKTLPIRRPLLRTQTDAICSLVGERRSRNT